MLAQDLEASIREILTSIQHNLFNLGGELSLPGHPLIMQQHVTDLEKQLDNLNENLEPLKDFILPGGTPAAAYTHLARTVCRRAERSLISLHSKETVSENILQYMNRLSDLLFVLARHINKQSGHSDILWQQDKNKD